MQQSSRSEYIQAIENHILPHLTFNQLRSARHCKRMEGAVAHIRLPMDPYV